MNRFEWQDFAEWGFRIFLGLSASGAGIMFVEKFGLGFLAQTFFWPIYTVLVYWLVIREIYFKRKTKPVQPLASVRVRFSLEDAGFGTSSERKSIHRFTDRLEVALAETGIARYDGDEFGEGECTLFMYGSNPEAVYEAALPTLKKASFLSGAKVELRAPGASIPFRVETL
jgi:hypothetical protein